MKKSFSKFLFEMVENESTSFFGRFLGNFISFLIIANVAAVALETVPSMKQYSDYFLYFEYFSIAIFAIEYGIRVWTAPYLKKFSGKNGRFRYALTPFMIFDLLVILPSALALLGFSFFDTRVLRIIRVFRIFRLQKYSQSLQQIFRILDVHKEILLSGLIMAFMAVIILSTIMFYIENHLQPEVFSSIPQTMYWAIITLSTIGYGDIVPISDAGKMLASITALLGVAIYSLPTAILGAAFYREAQSKEAKKIVSLERKIQSLEKTIEEYENSGIEKTERRTIIDSFFSLRK